MLNEAWWESDGGLTRTKENIVKPCNEKNGDRSFLNEEVGHAADF